MLKKKQTYKNRIIFHFFKRKTFSNILNKISLRSCFYFLYLLSLRRMNNVRYILDYYYDLI